MLLLMVQWKLKMKFPVQSLQVDLSRQFLDLDGTTFMKPVLEEESSRRDLIHQHTGNIFFFFSVLSHIEDNVWLKGGGRFYFSFAD